MKTSKHRQKANKHRKILIAITIFKKEPHSNSKSKSNNDFTNSSNRHFGENNPLINISQKYLSEITSTKYIDESKVETYDKSNFQTLSNELIESFCQDLKYHTHKKVKYFDTQGPANPQLKTVEGLLAVPIDDISVSRILRTLITLEIDIEQLLHDFNPFIHYDRNDIQLDNTFFPKLKVLWTAFCLLNKVIQTRYNSTDNKLILYLLSIYNFTIFDVFSDIFSNKELEITEEVLNNFDMQKKVVIILILTDPEIVNNILSFTAFLTFIGLNSTYWKLDGNKLEELYGKVNFVAIHSGAMHLIIQVFFKVYEDTLDKKDKSPYFEFINKLQHYKQHMKNFRSGIRETIK